jgi:hypothetical protein
MSSTNSQIIEAGIQSGTLTAERGASLSMGATFMAAANSIGLVMYNAVAVQQGTQQIAQATVATTCALMVANAGKAS